MVEELRSYMPCGTVKKTFFKNMWYIYKMEYYAAIRKKKILQFVTTQMDFEGIMLSEITETQKDKY